MPNNVVNRQRNKWQGFTKLPIPFLNKYSSRERTKCWRAFVPYPRSLIPSYKMHIHWWQPVSLVTMKSVGVFHTSVTRLFISKFCSCFVRITFNKWRLLITQATNGAFCQFVRVRDSPNRFTRRKELITDNIWCYLAHKHFVAPSLVLERVWEFHQRPMAAHSTCYIIVQHPLFIIYDHVKSSLRWWTNMLLLIHSRSCLWCSVSSCSTLVFHFFAFPICRRWSDMVQVEMLNCAACSLMVLRCVVYSPHVWYGYIWTCTMMLR